MEEEKRVRIVLAKLVLDDHSRPLYVISKALRDAGMEVINLGLFQTPELVVKAAMDEDADAIGLSFHTMTYIGWIGRMMNLLKEKKVENRSYCGREAEFRKDSRYPPCMSKRTCH